ncbi:hypothetical protein [Reichenbachiella sp.]|uniref:hypothetical protein n=1 Tax=Reichenbachiella sp. TaxID=2184521 RepID=UPI003BB2057D
MSKPFELFSFYSNLEKTLTGIEAGLTGVVVDLETKGKKGRQSLYNTQISKHHLSDLQELRASSSSHIICRINGGKYLSEKEILDVVESGANEILVPMITNLKQMDFLLDVVPDEIDLSIMIETNEAVNLASTLGEYPISRVFVGLNDLSIARKQKNLFLPLIDGTVEAVRSHIKCQFGVAGLTHPSSGYPVPCQMLINEMKRLRCTFGFLRRSFYGDLNDYTQGEIIRALQQEFSNNEVQLDYGPELKECILTANELFA